MKEFLSIHQIQSNPQWSAFSLFRKPIDSSSLFDAYKPEQFEQHGQKVGIYSNVCYRQSFLAAENSETEFAISTVSRRKPANPKRALDLWTVPSSDHVVSERGRDFIENQDPGVHTFLSVKLSHEKGMSRFGAENYFVWRIGRSLKIEIQDDGPPVQLNPDLHVGPHGPSNPISRALHSLCLDADARNTIRQFPFWCIQLWETVFVNDETFRKANEIGLKGFEPSSGHTIRNSIRVELPLLQATLPADFSSEKPSIWSRLLRRH